MPIITAPAPRRLVELSALLRARVRCLGFLDNHHVIMAIHSCDYHEVFPAHGGNKFAVVEDIEVD